MGKAGAGAGGPGSTGAVLRVDKPEGPTSHDVVAIARRVIGVRRVGHTGTLDPFASGLLLLCIGPATRLAEYLIRLPKSYRGTLRFGTAMDTDDRTGRVVERSDTWEGLTPAAIEAAFERQVGPILQTPPAFSAKRVGGERSYDRARRGERVEPAPVRVTVHRIAVLTTDLPDVEFEVDCSSGTYIRAIARDVGRAFGTVAHLRSLRRTRIGPHSVAGAVSPDRFGDVDALRPAMLSPLAALSHLPVVRVGPDGAEELAHGAAITCPEGAPAQGLVAVAAEGRLLAVGDVRDGRLQPRKVFPA